MKLKQLLKNRVESPEAGYTILEGIVAMVMVAALMTAVAPVIAFSVGTRVQARRIELGAQAARSYIDWVRAASDTTERNIRSPDDLTISLENLDPPTTGALTCNDGEYCTAPATASYSLYCVDGDNNNTCENSSLADMIIQAATYSTKYYSGGNPRYEMGYQLAVRVYRADAFNETDLCPESSDCPEKGTQQSAVTNAIGNRRLPVVEIVTEIGPLENSFDNLRDRLD